MFALSAAMALLVAQAPPPNAGAPLPDEAGVHLGVVLRAQDSAGLAALLAEQQRSGSPSYHAWLTPEEFGARFGLPAEDYDRVLAWLAGEGFVVTPAPNRLFADAVGTAGAVRRLLGVQLVWADQAGREAHTYQGELSIPAALRPLVLHVAGLDTRTHLRHRLTVTPFGAMQPTNLLGAADLRALYDMAALASSGTAAAGLTLAVLGTQEGTASGRRGSVGPPAIFPSDAGIEAYFTTLSGATAVYDPIALANPANDFDTSGANQEYQLDVEMQSVGAPSAAAIDLVLSPASEVFTTGAQYIANSLPAATAVSTSLGLCEAAEARYYGGSPSTPGSEMASLEQTVQQGLAEGQTWFAAAGDTGADDCGGTGGTGYGGGAATVDFPCSLPGIVCMGGSELAGPGNWNGSGDLTGWQAEAVWNESASQYGAGGGGQSLYFAKPSWQAGIGPEASDGARDVPDLALSAAVALPGIAVYACGAGQDSSCQGDTTGSGSIWQIGGTSVASPLAAGIFALLSGQLGCRQGDVHPTLYSLGQAQQGGGAAPFHDLTAGNNSYNGVTGFAAAAGYDLASGWGSVDVAQLVSAWPVCPAGGSSGGTSSSGGSTSGAANSSSGSSGGASSSGGGSSSGGAGSSGGASGSSGGGSSSGGTGSSGGASGSGGGSSSAGTGSSGGASGSSGGGSSSAGTGSSGGASGSGGGSSSAGTGSSGGASGSSGGGSSSAGTGSSGGASGSGAGSSSAGTGSGGGASGSGAGSSSAGTGSGGMGTGSSGGSTGVGGSSGGASSGVSLGGSSGGVATGGSSAGSSGTATAGGGSSSGAVTGGSSAAGTATSDGGSGSSVGTGSGSSGGGSTGGSSGRGSSGGSAARGGSSGTTGEATSGSGGSTGSQSGSLAASGGSAAGTAGLPEGVDGGTAVAKASGCNCAAVSGGDFALFGMLFSLGMTFARRRRRLPC